MSLPNVSITLGNGNLGRSQATSDGVAGLIVTGKAVAGKLELNKHYLLGSTRDLVSLGVASADNFLLDKEVKAFYAQAGDGAELHLLVVPEATTLTSMCAAEATSPLSKLIDAAAGRIKLVGVNKLAPTEYEADTAQGIDGDAISAAAAAQQCADDYTAKIAPFRVFVGCPTWTGSTENLYKPAEGAYNRVAMILASDDPTGKTAAVGQLLGRAASVEPQISIARVKDGAIAATGWFTNGKTFLEASSYADALHDAGYVFYRNYPTKNGCYINDDRMAAPVTDDYAFLNNGRIIDKAISIAYNTYISEIQDNVAVESDGTINPAVCIGYQSMIENAVGVQMNGQISGFSAEIDPKQNVLSSEELVIILTITPLATLKKIKIQLGFDNPAKQSV